MKKVLFVLLAAIVIVSLGSCKKDKEIDPISSQPNIFEKVIFNSKLAYFSTDGSMTAPVDSVNAKAIAAKIDITFIYNYDYSGPGFLDPITRSKTWYWNDYFAKWLNNAVETVYFSTALTQADFDAAKADQSKIASLLAGPSVVLAPHGIFPTGSCIGGRESSSPNSVSLAKGQVFGFKNVASGKQGLLYIRTDQGTAWPQYIVDQNTRVDIIREK